MGGQKWMTVDGQVKRHVEKKGVGLGLQEGGKCVLDDLFFGARKV